MFGKENLYSCFGTVRSPRDGNSGKPNHLAGGQDLQKFKVQKIQKNLDQFRQQKVVVFTLGNGFQNLGGRIQDFGACNDG